MDVLAVVVVYLYLCIFVTTILYMFADPHIGANRLDVRENVSVYVIYIYKYIFIGKIFYAFASCIFMTLASQLFWIIYKATPQERLEYRSTHSQMNVCPFTILLQAKSSHIL
jgi:hypothetical protein